MLRKIFFAGFAALTMASSSNAAVIVGLLLDPASTAGVATSTRSGPGSWQLYAIEDAAASDLGIYGYSIAMTGTTALNHRSPNGTVLDENGDSQKWGFTAFRTATNISPINGAQELVGQTPFLITGYGREASDANTKIHAIQASAGAPSILSGGSWGAYNSPALLPLQTSTGHKWVFIAEGLGSPTVGNVTATAFTVFSSTGGGATVTTPSSVVSLSEGVIPEPATATLVGIAILGGFGLIRRRNA